MTTREVLKEERKKLQKRITEINNELNNLENHLFIQNYKAVLTLLKDNYEIDNCESLIVYSDDKQEDVEIFLDSLIAALEEKVKE